MVAAALVVVIAAYLSTYYALTVILISAGSAFSSVAILVVAADIIRKNRSRKDQQAITDFIVHDASPSVFATEDGVVTAMNMAAKTLNQDNAVLTVAAFLAP